MKTITAGFSILPADPLRSPRFWGRRAKFCKTLVLALAGLAVAQTVVHAATISLNFNYSDLNGLVSGRGTFTALPISDEPGVYAATAGTLTITAPAADNISGTYTLFSNTATPNYQLSPTGLFIYDDLIFPGGNPVVTNPGLLAFGGQAVGGVPEGEGREINFFSNGAHVYDLYAGVNGGYPYSFEFTDIQGSVTAEVSEAALSGKALSAAPEPAAWLTMGTFLLVAIYYGRSKGRVRGLLPE